MRRADPRAHRHSPERVQALLDSAAAGDRGAREELARWCLGRVRRTVLLSYGPGPEHDDLVQTAMGRIFGHLDSFRGESRFTIWVDRIAMNAVRDHFRSRRWVVLQPLDEENPEHQVAQVPTDELSERSRLMRRLATHFAGLRPALRLPLVLALLHGYTVPEIAVILDIGFEAAKKRLLRGRRELLDSLEQDPYCRAILAEMGR